MIETQEIKRVLNHYINAVLCADNPNDRAYHPADGDLKNHIYKAKRVLELSKLSQHNLKLKLQEWESSHPDSPFTFDRMLPKTNNHPLKMTSISCHSTVVPILPVFQKTVVMHNNLNKHFSGFIKLSGKRKC